MSSPKPIDRHEVARLLREGAKLVEVLPAGAYEKEHVAGALSIPPAVVLGSAALKVLEAGEGRPVGEVMHPAPSTWRPHLRCTGRHGGGRNRGWSQLITDDDRQAQAGWSERGAGYL